MRLQLTRSASRRAYTSGSSVIDQALSADPPCAIARWKRFRPAAAAGELTSLYIIQLLAGALRVCGTGTVCDETDWCACETTPANISCACASTIDFYQLPTASSSVTHSRIHHSHQSVTRSLLAAAHIYNTLRTHAKFSPNIYRSLSTETATGGSTDRSQLAMAPPRTSYNKNKLHTVVLTDTKPCSLH